MADSDKYFNSVTIVKAIGIILMVFAHAINDPSTPGGYFYIHRFIYAFHMPLFFIMSGFCFKEKYLDNTILFITQKIKGIYIPFLVFSLIFVALHNVFCSLHIYNLCDLYQKKDFWNAFVAIITRMGCYEDMLGTFWFLKQLFIGNILFYLTIKICKRHKWITFVFLLILSEVLSIVNQHITVKGITSLTLLSTTFIYAGYIIHTTNFRVNKWWKILICIAIVAVQTIWASAEKMTDAVEVPTSITPYFLAGVAGTMLVYESSILLNKFLTLSFLAFVGQHTLSIMTFHFLSFKLASFIIILIYKLPITQLSEFPILYAYTYQGWWILYTIVGITIPLFLSWMYKKLQNYHKITSFLLPKL